MLPLKTYIFEMISNENIKLEIKAYDFKTAYSMLLKVTDYPDNFKTISI